MEQRTIGMQMPLAGADSREFCQAACFMEFWGGVHHEIFLLRCRID